MDHAGKPHGIKQFFIKAGGNDLSSGLFEVSSGDRGCSPGHWLARNAMELIPLGMYMEEISPAATDVEDKETYEMILAKQAQMKMR